MKFVKNPFLSPKMLLIICVILSGGMASYFGFFCGKKILEDRSLNTRTRAEVAKWEVEELSNNQYVILAFYSYEHESKKYFGKSPLDEPVYWNAASAIEAIKTKLHHSEPLMVWLDRHHPEESSLVKKFPTKELFRFTLSALVSVYFLLLLVRNARQ